MSQFFESRTPLGVKHTGIEQIDHTAGPAGLANCAHFFPSSTRASTVSHDINIHNDVD